jgi:hypothetical protein
MDIAREKAIYYDGTETQIMPMRLKEELELLIVR